MFIGNNSEINVKVNGVLYPIDSLIGKTVYARKDTLLYRDGYGTAPQMVKRGGVIGRVFSWITIRGEVYFMFMLNSGSSLLKYYPAGSFYVKVSDIDEKTLKEQGAKSTKQQEKEKQEKEESANETNVDKLTKTLLKLGFGIAAIYALTSLGKTAIISRK